MSDQDEELAFQSYVSEHGAGAPDPETGLEPTPYEEGRNFFAAGRRSMAGRVAELETVLDRLCEAAARVVEVDGDVDDAEGPDMWGLGDAIERLRRVLPRRRRKEGGCG